jgi:hypothetical protein
MTQLQTLVANSGTVAQIGENFDATSAAGMYGRRAPGVVGLTWAYYGGRGFGNTIADGTVALTASTTNYIVADRSTGAVSVSTATTNWDDSANYYRCYLIVTGTATITTATDYREFVGGSSGGGSSAWGDLTGVPAPIEDIAALTDPGADRLLFWDDSAGEYTHATLGTNLSFTGTTLNAAGGGGGSGTVTSVGMTVPGILSVSGSPVTTSGTLAVTGVDAGSDKLVFWDDSAGDLAYLTLGTNLSITGTTLDAAGGGGGGLTNWTESVTTAVPNATVPVVRLLATNAATDVDIALSPKGAGGIAAHVANNSSSGGNKRGANAVDLQTLRSDAAMVASGTASFVMGQANRASGNYSAAVGGYTNVASASFAAVVGGRDSTSSGNAAVVVGGDTCAASGEGSVVLGGANNTADGIASFVSGTYGSARGLRSSRTLSAVNLTGAASAQKREAVLCTNTTDATPKVLTVNAGGASADNVFVFADNSANAFEILVSAKVGTFGDRATYKITGMISRGANAAATVVDGTPTVTALATVGGASAWVVAVSANTTLGSLAVTVTGVAATAIRWVAAVTTTEVVG